MKIRRTLLSSELEFTPSEIEEIFYKIRPQYRSGLVRFIKCEFNLDLLPAFKKEDGNA